MTYRTDIHYRRRIRLQGYDYSQPGAYFVTVCTQNRACLLGEIMDDEMHLNDAGRMVKRVWDEIPTYYPGIDIDAFVVMPNHLHGIILLGQARGPAPTYGTIPVGAALRGRLDAGPASNQQYTRAGSEGEVRVGRQTEPALISGTISVGAAPRGRLDVGSASNQQHRRTGLSLPDVVQRLKTMTTKHYADGVKQLNWPGFPGRLWQRSYYEHIIRDEHSLTCLREYIANNPLQWTLDCDNPVNVP